MFNNETNNLSIARDALSFCAFGISFSSHDEEGYEGLVKDYKAEANHLAENREPMTDQTSFDISVSNDIYTELTIEDMAQVLCIELDRITDVFKDVIVDIPEASVNRVKAAIDACKTLYHLVYSKDGLSQEEIDLIPPVELNLSFNFDAQERPEQWFAGTVSVSLKVVSTGSLDHLMIEDDPLSADDNMIVNAAIEWFYSTVRQDFKPFDLDVS